MLKGKKFLITGAMGFLGGHLVNSLLETEAQITAVDIAEPNRHLKEICGDRVRWFQADIIEDDLSEFLFGINVVYHLVGISGQVLKELCNLNVNGTRNVAKASVDAGVQRFIHISSAAVCGVSDNRIITEKDVNPNGSYGLSKLKSEEVVKEICKDKMDYVILRPTAFFGENHLGSLYEMARTIKQKRYFMIGNGTNNMNFLYVKDFVDILVKVAENSKVVNQSFLVADETISLKDFTNITRIELNLKPTNFYIPKSLGMVMGLGFDIISKSLHKSMPLSVKRVVNMTNDANYSGSKILQKLSTRLPYGVKKGWIQTIKWYMSKGLL